MNLPNKLTIARMIAVPFFIFFYTKEWYIPALILFLAASFTDLLDGKIARKYNLVTNFGKIMDPLADKILVYSAFCLMVEDQTIRAWMLILILVREFLVAGIRTVAASQGKVIAAAMSGKIKTVLQMVAVPLLILFRGLTASSGGSASAIGVLMVLGYLAYVFLWASLIMTAYSGVEYVWKNLGVFQED